VEEVDGVLLVECDLEHQGKINDESDAIEAWED
jgi:hypothetical protein